MNITITGDVGSGKSTVSKRLAEMLDMTIVDTGTLYREYSAKKGIDVLSQNKSDDWSIDRKIDNTITEMGKTRDNIIFVSRLAWYFVPDAIHIYLAINPVLAAKRIASCDSRISESHNSWEETLRYNKERKGLELRRYSSMYSIAEPSGYTNADIVICVGKNDVDAVVNCIVQAVRGKAYGFYIDPKILIPTQGIRDYNTNTLCEYTESLKDEVPVIDAITQSWNSNYYILDGHHRILASIKLGKPFIVIPKPSVAERKPDIPTLYDYEDLASISLTDELYLHDMSVDAVIEDYRRKLNLMDTYVWSKELQRLKDISGLSTEEELASFIQNNFM